MLGARGNLQAAAPRMADQLLDEALTATKDTKPRIDAINSALDRAGVPRMKEIAISISADVGQAAAAFDHLEGEAIEGTSRVMDAGAQMLLPINGIDLKNYLSRLEKNLIEQALDDTNSVVARAADRLQIRRTTLVEKMRKYGLHRTDSRVS